MNEPIDFFTTTPDAVNADYCVSNMPFSLKKEVFTRLKEVGKPFVMIVPTLCLQTKYFHLIERVLDSTVVDGGVTSLLDF